jgi:hypothetical protein
MYPLTLLSSFLLKPQGNAATDQAKFAKPTKFTHAPKVIPVLINKTNRMREIAN